MNVQPKQEIKDEPFDVDDSRPTTSQRIHKDEPMAEISQNGTSQHVIQQDEPMEDGPDQSTEVRAVSPPLRQRSRSRSRTRERSVELQANFEEVIDAETLVNEDKIEQKFDNAGVPYEHSLFFVNQYSRCDLPIASIKRLQCYKGCIRAALEAFEYDHHMFFASDNSNDRKVVVDYIRRKTLSDVHSPRHIIFIVRNESIARQKHSELSKLLSNVHYIPFHSNLNQLHFERRMCFITTIYNFRSLYMKYPGAFSNYLFIFDDFHYIGNSEVGNLYEEALLKPPNGQCIFITPSFANVSELSRWICRNDKQRAIESIQALKRKPAVSHFITRKNEMFMGQVIDQNVSDFREGPFILATKTTQKKTGEKKVHEAKFSEAWYNSQPQIVKLIRSTMFRDRCPILIHSFDTEDIERIVNSVDQMNFNSEQNQNMVDRLFETELKLINDKEDREYGPVKKLKPFLQRGIAPYHYGMLPLMRELIEFFFENGLIKVIVADDCILRETNFYFQAAIITCDRKLVEPGYYRWIKPYEYKEICDRLIVPEPPLVLSQHEYKDTCVKVDEFPDHHSPMVILINGDEDMPVNVAKEIFKNNLASLESQFSINFPLVLLTINSPIHSEKKIISQSLAKFQMIAKGKKASSDLLTKDAIVREFDLEDENDLDKYCKLKETLDAEKEKLREKLFIRSNFEKFLDVGRVVKIRKNNHDFGYSVIVNCSKERVYATLNVSKESYEADDENLLRPPSDGCKEVMDIFCVEPKNVYVVTAERLRLPERLFNDNEKEFIKAQLNEMVKRTLGEISELTMQDLSCSTYELKKKDEAIARRERELKDLQNQIIDFRYKWQKYQEKDALHKEANELEKLMEDAKCEDMETKLDKMLRLLATFGYVEDDDSLSPKAKFAINLPIEQSFFVTELMFHTFFNDKVPNDLIYVLSTCIKMEVTSKIDLATTHSDKIVLFDGLKEQTQKIGAELRKRTIIPRAEDYMKNFNPTLFPFLDRWCKSLSFKASMDQTDLRPGFIATYLRRLDRLFVHMLAAIEYMPPTLPGGFSSFDSYQEVLTDLRKLINRDIPFVTTSKVEFV